jgi:hypothetical protein
MRWVPKHPFLDQVVLDRAAAVAADFRNTYVVAMPVLDAEVEAVAHLSLLVEEANQLPVAAAVVVADLSRLLAEEANLLVAVAIQVLWGVAGAIQSLPVVEVLTAAVVANCPWWQRCFGPGLQPFCPPVQP